MGLTNFPNGISSFGVPIVPAAAPDVIAGEVFYVCATAATGGKWLAGVDDPSCGSAEKPFATIDYAIGKCVASRGDVIYVLPGHTEAVAAAGGIACDVAGISIIGLGNGSLRPTITLGTSTAASITVSAANIKIKNLIFIANLDNVATCFTVSAKDCTIDGCEFRDTANNKHFLSHILTNAVANSCDGLTIINNKAFQLAVAATAFISILENNDRVTIKHNLVVSASTADVGHFIIMSSKNLTNTEISYNRLIVTGAANASVGIFMTGSGTGMTGSCDNNYVSSLDTTGALFCTATITFGLFENKLTGAVGASGLLWPAADNPA